jgi:tetratricopeptide (TPR) repeat protein
MGDDKYFSLLQQFDVLLELGRLHDAATILNSFKDKNTFEYCIRLAKMEDHRGHSTESVKWMEKAVKKADEEKNKTLLLWAKANLADMCGHTNRVKKAYHLYIDVLKKDRNNTHALKGIAWIAFSHDKNTTTAKNILNYLKTIHPVPDYDLLLSEIAVYEGNRKEKESSISNFLNEVNRPAYGDMYNKYVFMLLCGEETNYSEIMRIAQKEVNNRPTSQSYDLLAWAYYKNNNLDEAIKIAEAFVVNKNSEPDALYHLGKLYKQSGNKSKAAYYLKKALASGFEMGPVMANEIKEELSAL